MRTDHSLILWVAAGSAVGGVLRHLTGDLFRLIGWLDWPWDTLTANVLGSLVIGWFAALTAVAGRWPLGMVPREFVITGILGGYTTFSLFSLDTISLMNAGQWGAALANMFATLVLCLTAVWLGYRIGHRAADR